MDGKPLSSKLLNACPISQLNKVSRLFIEQPPLLSLTVQVKSLSPGELSKVRGHHTQQGLIPASCHQVIGAELFLGQSFHLPQWSGSFSWPSTGNDTVPTGMSKTGQSDLLTPCRSKRIATHPECAEVPFPLWWSHKCHPTYASDGALHSLLFKDASQKFGRMQGGVKSRQGFLGGSLFTPFAMLSVEAKVIHLPTIHLEIRICLSPMYEDCLVVLSERVTHTQP